MSHMRLAILLLVVGVLSVGCASRRSVDVSFAMAHGEFGEARVAVANSLTDRRNDRQFLLDRMRLGVLTMDDGYTQSALNVFADVYEILRTQGVNRDKTVASVVINEDLKLWKGEPFEQALAFTYYGMAQAQSGSWDNARAAFNNALFYLRDFGSDEEGQRLDTYAIAQRSLVYERALDQGRDPEEALRTGGINLEHGYIPTPSNYTLGYLLNAVANQQLDRHDEAADNFGRVLQLDPGLGPLVEVLRDRRYNTLLVVGYGFGPRKEGYGPDRAFARFTPRTPSTTQPLAFAHNGQRLGTLGVVTDVNHMAADHMWNNLEDIRHGKSVIGTIAVQGGTLALLYGLNSDDEVAALAGLGALAAGAFMKAGAHADTRYCDAFPQRFYIVPLLLESPGDRVELTVEGQPQSRLVLTGLGPPPGPPRGPSVQLRYVRLVHGFDQPPDWAVSGQIVVGNPVTGAAGPAPLPYILGGQDARPPTDPVLDDYQASGNLTGWTLSDLREAYRSLGVLFTVEQHGGYAGRHVVEHGKSLVAPAAGTTGFMRLFAQPPPPYDPRPRPVARRQP